MFMIYSSVEFLNYIHSESTYRLTSHFPPGYWMLFRLGIIVLFTISLFSKVQKMLMSFLGGVTLDIGREVSGDIHALSFKSNTSQ
jgi:hypothetical protein